MIYILLPVSLYLTYYDIRYKRVPNLIVLSLFITLLTLKIFLGEPLISAFISGSAAFITFLLIHIFSGKKLGMGDCKYTAVIAFNFGYFFWLQSIIYCSFIALVVSLFLLVIKKIDKKTRIPFIPFLVSGWLLNYILPLPV